MFLKIFKINNKKQEKQVMNYLNATASCIYDARKEEVLNGLENDLQRVIFLDWWYGGSLWEWNEEKRDHERAKRYRHVSDHDWDEANGWIMETVSLGMG